MAEGARLESVYTGNRIVGSNPTLSAISSILAWAIVLADEDGRFVSGPTHFHFF